jgi:hypothetical protein
LGNAVGNHFDAADQIVESVGEIDAIARQLWPGCARSWLSPMMSRICDSETKELVGTPSGGTGVIYRSNSPPRAGSSTGVPVSDVSPIAVSNVFAVWPNVVVQVVPSAGRVTHS